MQSSTPLRAPPTMPAARPSYTAASEPSWRVSRAPPQVVVVGITGVPANEAAVLPLETGWDRILYHDLFSDRPGMDLNGDVIA